MRRCSRLDDPEDVVDGFFGVEVVIGFEIVIEVLVKGTDFCGAIFRQIRRQLALELAVRL